MSRVRTTGSCLCVQLRIEIDGEPLTMVHCCCEDCQKASGAGHISGARFREEDVRITGEHASYGVKTRSGNINTRHFCPRCGSRVFGTSTGRPGIVTVYVGVLDDTSWFRPAAVIFDEHRRAWDVFPEDLPRFDTVPPGAK